MTIYYFVPVFMPKESGFSIAFKNFCSILQESEKIKKIYVVTSEKKPPFIHSKIEYIYFDKYVWCDRILKLFGLKIGYTLISFVLNFYLSKFITNEKKSVFFVESVFLSYLSLFLSRKYKKVPVITRIHGCLPEVAVWTNGKYRNNLMKLLLRTNLIAVTTYHYIDYLRHNFSLKEDNLKKFFVIPNTLPKTLPNLVSESNFEINTKKIKLLQLGRMNEQGFFQKGFQDVLQALFYLESTLPSGTLSEIEYTYIGSGHLFQSFQKELKKLKYIKIRLFSSLTNEEVQKELISTDVVLMPSRYEGMSMFATEALAKGKPFIFTSDGGLRDMILHNYNGLSVRPFDYLGIAKAIVNLKNSPQTRLKFSKNSIELFNNEFSYQKVGEKFDVLLKTLF